MEVFTLKVILLVAMIAFTIVAGMFPVRLLKLLRKRAALAATPGKASVMSLTLCLLTCFSGGVFLGTCFMHLFPELLEHLEKMKQSYSYDLHYPVAELLSCLGFFLLFFLEELVLKLIPSLGHGHSHGTGNVELACEHSQMEHRHAHDHHKMYHQQTSPTEDHSDKLLLNSATSATDNGPTSSRNCASNTDCIESYGIALAEPERCETDCEKVDEHPPILMKSRPHAHSHGVRSITFVLAISIHSVIEGLAFGVQNETGEVAALFISLMVHKVIVAFSVGLQLARTHAHSLGWVAASICLLAIMTPIGAMCGMLVQGASIDSEAKDMIVLIFQGMAVGTFLYVTFFEVLLHERDNEHPNMLKLAMMLLGFALIALVRFVDNGHSHGPLGGSGNGTHVHDHDGHNHDH
ncbi:hypothetical protein L596_010141 [Steinernema carpocapsae]|uniref:Zinc/iron permease n=1 Tax=Steinernema carpocapsae TaxID=34508 RepID=A0A4U5PIR5_STECR|nr:hypothetical protein L596_010141 [Steinernema carpocapsae]